MGDVTRREWLAAATVGGLGTLHGRPWASAPDRWTPGQPAISDSFPRHDPALAQEVVGQSHSNLARVKELVTRQPALAKASWDWGFGDWETALGAAAHTGQKDIARLLLDHGAPPTLYSAAMLGQLDIVRAFLTMMPGAQRQPGPHGITLLSHARAGGAEAAEVVAYLLEVGGADDRPTYLAVDPADRARLVGTYRFGAGGRDVFVVDEAREQLGLLRPGGSRRGLFCIAADASGWTFVPVGSAAVRIRFERADNGEFVLTIADPNQLLSARRSQEP
jgi:hypothetical protein